MDSADAYEKHALRFLDIRDTSTIGADIARRWARSLEKGTEVFEIACGGGYPVTQALSDAGLRLWAIDASPTLLDAFRARFPGIPTQCVRTQETRFFDREYDAVIAIGFIFLLSESDQLSIIRRVAEILRPGGRFLFTAPLEIGTWIDVVTGFENRSLGRDRYESALEASGFRLIGTYEDEGNNNYYEVERTVAETG